MRFPLRLFRALAGPRGRFAPRADDVAALGGDLYRATGPDPRFVFRAPLPLAPLALLCRSERPGGLAPRIYLDWGEGFAPLDSFGLAPGETCWLRLDPSGCPDLRALRFDPFEGGGVFMLRFAAGAAAGRLTQAANGAAQIVALADFGPARGARAIGLKRTPRTAQEHFERTCALAGRELAGRFADPPSTPTISFVTPVFDTPPAYLDDLLASFRAQATGYAELIFSDDGSTSAPTLRWLDAHSAEAGLVVRRGDGNRGIASASNAGVERARGGWVGFIDHDDVLAPHAVAVLLRALGLIRHREERSDEAVPPPLERLAFEHGAAGSLRSARDDGEPNPPRLGRQADIRFLYTDELIADGRLQALDFFDKPAFDDVLLSGVNYVNHLSLYRRDLFAELGGFREGFDGSQDYDLLLRASQKLRRDEIRHVPYPAYVWRRDGRSYSVTQLERATANARRALAQAYGVEMQHVEPAILPDLHRVRLDRAAPRPKISVVLTPNSGSAAQVVDALDDDIEVIVVADDAPTPAVCERLSRNLTFLAEPGSPSARFNFGAARARGDAILRLDDALAPTTPDWLDEMAACLAYARVGVVGARLLLPGGVLRHAGTMIAPAGLAWPWRQGRPADFPGPMGRLAVRSTVAAASGAAMLIGRACWEAAGPFDAEAAPCDDADFCLRARDAGFRTLYTPFATLVGPAPPPPERPALLRAQALFLERHGASGRLDPAVSPWLDGEDSVRLALDALPPAR